MRRNLPRAIVLALCVWAPCCIAVAGDLPASPAVATNAATTQLPRAVRPTHYDIAVVPNAHDLRFNGRAAIDIVVLQATDRIVLNALDMTFPKAQLRSVDGALALGAPRVSVDRDAQTATFTFAHAIAPGSYRLALDYTGRIGTQANGLFAIDYDTAAGKQRALYTQFENSDARRFMPSWDEPAYKATFTLSADVPAGQMAVSNMPVAQTTDLGHGMQRVRFQTTPKMSSYLLFFGLGDFERATTHLGDTQIGVVTQRGKGAQAAFALDSAKAILAEYNDYFGTHYPLPKLDNIAAPGSSQFFSAMENWGAIFTFERAMLLDPAFSTQADRQGVFAVEAHEMAHQWFGDLVTMAWWDDLWLNEGFASWMEGRTTAKLHPEWHADLDTVDVRESAMSRDAVATTHPVVQHIATVEQASQAFDSITYSKGESVIRMLEAYVGADAWRAGVRDYMREHAYGNTTSDDLWRAVEHAAGKPIMTIAHDFTLQPGVPLIEVKSAICTNSTTTLNLAQGEFSKDRPDKHPLAWRVPVIARTLDGAPVSALVSDGHATMSLPGCGTVVVNAGQSGYYRTLYQPAQIAQIGAHFPQVATIDQLGILGDAWALGMAGRVPASTWLDLAAKVPADADPQVWGDIADSFDSIDGYFRGDSPQRTAFRRFAIARLQPVLARVGWVAREGEPDPVVNLRTQLIATLGTLGDPAVLAEARRRYAAQATDPQAMPVALRRTLLGIVAANADAATWDGLHAKARAETTPLVKDQLYEMLAAAKDPALARRALELAITDEPGATNGAMMISVVAWRHPELAFAFATAHTAQVDPRVDSTSRSRYYPGLASGSLDPATIGKVRAFADAHIAPTSRRAADTAIANIQYRIGVRERAMPQIDAWIAQHAAP
ncbi:MAG: M1 family metallopeptidase [Proteobacteria bacterium]|nr:M1 family metallopeptidase [Pseudomonadota bacterium]